MIFIKKYMYFYNLRRVRLDCNIYFLFEKQAFNGLLKVIGIQTYLVLKKILTFYSRLKDFKMLADLK